MFLGNELNKDNESVDNLRWQENKRKHVEKYLSISERFQ